MLKLCAWLFLLALSVCILPSLHSPNVLINPSNEYQLADYTFSFSIKTTIKSSATLEIQFPPEFASTDLGNANCTLTGRVCSFGHLNGIQAGEYDVTVSKVTNPRQGGLSNFQVRTKIGQAVIEESRIFTNAGIRDSVDSFLFIELSVDDNVAGVNATYSLRFKTRQSYAYSTTLQVGLWSFYNQSSITETYDSIDNTVSYTLTLPLRNPYSIDSLPDLPAKIYKGTYLLVKGMVKNPQFVAAKLNCQMNYQPWIATNSQYKIMDYDFTVVAPYQPIVGSQLEVIVPEYFARYNTGTLGSLYYYGYDNNALSFMGDRVFLMDIANNTQSMGFRMRLRNPYIVGTTSPFRLSMRYQGSLYMFDQSTCTTTINSQIPADLVRPLNFVSTDARCGASTDITLALPATPANNQVIINIPSDFTLNGATVACAFGAGYAVSICTVSGSIITVVSSVNFTAATTLKLSNAITNPLTNGTYLVQIWMGDYSYTDLLYVSSISNTFGSVEALGNTLTLSFASAGIVNGSVSLQVSSVSMLNRPIECSLSGLRIGCSFNTPTNIQLQVLNLTEGSTYILVISGLTVTGSTTLLLKQYQIEEGRIVMQQTLSQTVTFPSLTYTECGQTSLNYGVRTSLSFGSCVDVIGPVRMVIQTDSQLRAINVGLQVNGENMTQQTYFNYSIIMDTFAIGQVTNVALTNLQPATNQQTSNVIISIKNGTGIKNFRYNISIDAVNQIPTTLVVSSNAKLDVGVVYNFTITPIASTPTGSLLITFPSTYYSLNGSGSWAQSNLKSQVSVEQTRVIVNGVTLNQGTVYYVAVFGVVNPNITKVTGFTVHFTEDSTLNVLAQQLKNITATIDSAFALANMSTSIEFYPQNALMTADYSFTLSVPRAIPAKSSLLINFPSEFAALGFPICSVEEYGFSSCLMISNLSIQLTILNALAPNTSLQISISNLTNPFQGVTSPFSLSLLCNSVLIAQSPSLSLKISKSCKLSTQLALSYSPTTVGEESVYEFSYLPSEDITFKDQLFVRFPYEFDIQIGRGISCTYVDGYGKEYPTVCDVGQRNRQVAMGVGEWAATTGKSVVVRVVGVVNVNQNTDNIIIGIKSISSQQYREGSITLAGVAPTQPASPLIFNQLQATNAFIRQSASYSIEIYTKFPISCDTMSVYIVFPYYIYELGFGSFVSCSSDQFNAQCSVTYNNRIKVTPVGMQKIPAGLISISLFGVANPVDVAWISAYYVEIFDELNRLVVGRTYANLEFYSLTFTANGPFIKFNNDQSIYMNEGTTFQFNVTISEVLITQIQARGFGPFSFLPYLVTLPVGTRTQSMSISSPKGQTGDFTIKWSIMGDLSPIYYTPVKRTVVYVQAVLTKIWIVPTESPIVVRGCSEIIAVNLEYSPDTNIVVEVYDSSNALLNSLNFIRGQKQQFFSICNKTAPGVISFRTSGINQPNYELTTLQLNYTTGVGKSPAVSMFALNTTAKTNVTFNITIDTASSLLLVTSLEDSAIPTNISRSSLSLNILTNLVSTTQTQFLELIYSTPAQNLKVNAIDLTSNISYQSSLYILSTNNTYQLVDTIHYWTASFDPVCELVFNFNSALSTIDQSSFLQTVSYTLSVPLWILKANPFQANSSVMRVMIGQVQNNSQFPLPCLVSQNLYIRPQRLQSRIHSLKLQSPYTSNTGPITPIPTAEITLTSYNLDYLTFSVDMSSYGNVYSVLTQDSDDLSSVQQVYLGLGAGNVPAVQAKVLPKVRGANQLSFRMLQAFKIYRLCIVVGNVDPLPSLTSNTSCLSAKTQYPPGRIILKITWEPKLALLWVLLVLILIH